MQILAAFFLTSIKINVPMLLLGDDAAGVRQKNCSSGSKSHPIASE
jgi:hypothetical protein